MNRTNGALQESYLDAANLNAGRVLQQPVWVWGLPFAPVTRAECLDELTTLVRAGGPAYIITANTHYAMLTSETAELQPVNQRATFIVADGTPLVWASRLQGTPLPERVTGSDLIFDLAERAAREEFRVFLLGGGEGVAEQAAERLKSRYPGLQIVGTESPPYRALTDEENAAMKDRVRAAAPHILMVAFTMPKGEHWIHRNVDDLGVPLCLNVGAALDFAAGRVRRAPRSLQVAGLEWAFRLGLEPRRMFSRYARNARFAFHMALRDLAHATVRRLRETRRERTKR